MPARRLCTQGRGFPLLELPLPADKASEVPQQGGGIKGGGAQLALHGKLTLLLAVQTKVTSTPGFTLCTDFSSTVTMMGLLRDSGEERCEQGLCQTHSGVALPSFPLLHMVFF